MGFRFYFATIQKHLERNNKGTKDTPLRFIAPHQYLFIIFLFMFIIPFHTYIILSIHRKSP